MLRPTLIIFAWAIPFAVVMSLGVGLYLNFSLSPSGNENNNTLLIVISRIAGSIDALALSPLCFFAAKVLKAKEISSR